MLAALFRDVLLAYMFTNSVRLFFVYLFMNSARLFAYLLVCQFHY